MRRKVVSERASHGRRRRDVESVTITYFGRGGEGTRKVDPSSPRLRHETAKQRARRCPPLNTDSVARATSAAAATSGAAPSVELIAARSSSRWRLFSSLFGARCRGRIAATVGAVAAGASGTTGAAAEASGDHFLSEVDLIEVDLIEEDLIEANLTSFIH